MAGSEAYREARRGADAAWRWLAVGSVTALAGGVAAGLTARHIPLCFWLLHALATAQQAPVACWGLRLTTAACMGIACAVGLVLGRQPDFRKGVARRLRAQAPAPRHDLTRSYGRVLLRQRRSPDTARFRVNGGARRRPVHSASGPQPYPPRSPRWRCRWD